MSEFIAIAVFVFGTIVGSFLNVVSLRYNTGLSIRKGRSKCFSCGYALAWLDLIPILSFLFLGGRCRKCQSKISLQYPLVECATGLLFVFTFLVESNPPLLLILWIAFSLLVVIFVYDLKHKIIPDALVYAFDALGLIFLVYGVYRAQGHIPSAHELLAGVYLALPFALLWVVSKGRWIGLGDAKLALGMGWFLGLASGFTAIVLSFWIGAVVSVGILLVSKILGQHKFSMKSEIPFAPFMIISFLIVYFFTFTIFPIPF